jgi:hypothetical protein
MSQSQLQKSHTNTNRQDNVVMDQLQVLGMIPRSTHESTRREAKEPIKLGKFLRTDRTVRLAVADCPEDRRGLSAVQKTLPAEKTVLSKRPQPLAECPPAADCPPTTRGRSVEEFRRKTRMRNDTSPKSSPDLPNG